MACLEHLTGDGGTTRARFSFLRYIKIMGKTARELDLGLSPRPIPEGWSD